MEWVGGGTSEPLDKTTEPMSSLEEYDALFSTAVPGKNLSSYSVSTQRQCSVAAPLLFAVIE